MILNKNISVIGFCPSDQKQSSTETYQENLRYLTPDDVRKIARKNPDSLAIGDWKRILTAEQFKVTRLNCTEIRNTSPLNKVRENGIFQCTSCWNPLFDYKSKYNSGTGWPSFFQPLRPDSVLQFTDYDAGYARTDIRCSKCGAHLGHMFHDGPEPSGLRYCMNGIAMQFLPVDNLPK